MSIKGKLVLIFVSVLFGLFSIFGVNFYGGILVEQTRKLELLANQGTAEFLQARRQEKNFGSSTRRVEFDFIDYNSDCAIAQDLQGEVTAYECE